MRGWSCSGPSTLTAAFDGVQSAPHETGRDEVGNGGKRCGMKSQSDIWGKGVESL